MALRTNEVFEQIDGAPNPKIDCRRTQQVKMAPGTNTLVHVVGTLLALDTSNKRHAPWDPNGSNGLDTAVAILYPEKFTPHATDESLAVAMIAGTVRLEDIVAGDGVTATAQEIKDAVAGFRSLGIVVQNHDEAY